MFQSHPSVDVVAGVLKTAGFSTRIDLDFDGIHAKELAVVGDGHGHHGHNVTIFADVPMASVYGYDGAREAQKVVATQMAKALYDAGLCPSSRLGWHNSLLLVEMNDDLYSA